MTNGTSKRSSPGSAMPLSQTATTLATIAGAILAFATIVGFCLHLSGDVAYSTYLTSLGIQPTLFPQAADWKMIHGYYVTLLQGLGLLKDVPWGAVLVIFGLFTLAIVIIRIPVKENSELRGWFDRQSFWVKQPIVAALGSTLFLASATCVGCCILLLAIVPGLAGERFGKAKAEETKMIVQQEVGLSELWRDNQRFSSGHIITSNEGLIAIYDTDLKTMRTLPRERVEIRTLLPPLKPPMASK